MELPAREDIFKSVMAYPAVRFLGFCGVLALAGERAVAEEFQPNSTKPAQPTVPSSRVVSERVAGLLAAATPHYAVVKPAETSPSTSPIVRVDKPANEIVRLPNFVVREPRVPTSEAVRTPRGLQVYAMRKYLGDPDGFSRGVLNHLTLADGWTKLTKNIPVLNWFEWASSPEKTALDMYYDDEVRKKMRDLYGLLEIRDDRPRDANRKAISAPPASSPSVEKK